MRPSQPSSSSLEKKLLSHEVLNGRNPFSAFQVAIIRETEKLGADAFVRQDYHAVLDKMRAEKDISSYNHLVQLQLSSRNRG